LTLLTFDRQTDIVRYRAAITAKNGILPVKAGYLKVLLPHTKFQSPSTTPFRGDVDDLEEEEKKRIIIPNKVNTKFRCNA
jgi:hypothetical protein